MTNSKIEIAHALGGDFSAFTYYADDYTSEKDLEIYENLTEANEAFGEAIKERGLEALPLGNYINGITN